MIFEMVANQSAPSLKRGLSSDFMVAGKCKAYFCQVYKWARLFKEGQNNIQNEGRSIRGKHIVK